MTSRPGAKAAYFDEARRGFHAALLDNGLLTADNGIPTNADKHSRPSVEIAKGILSLLGSKTKGARLAGQMSGSKFEEVVGQYLEAVFPRLHPLRPGKYEVIKGSTRLAIAACDQYDHLAAVEAAAKADPVLAVSLGIDYLIKPDVMVLRRPESDELINRDELLVDRSIAKRTSIRAVNNSKAILHASVSCKWTLRSDRAQNARSEALNLVRNRKGRLPHVVVVTGEPTPGRIASIALGTGDIDCVYHIALDELVETVDALGYEDSRELLNTMIEGKRLRDIADLPFDLAT